jgi:hypothetical protein
VVSAENSCGDRVGDGMHWLRRWLFCWTSAQLRCENVWLGAGVSAGFGTPVWLTNNFLAGD